MPNELLSVEEGRAKIFEVVPEVLKTKINHIEYYTVSNQNTLEIKVEDRVLKMPWAVGQVFKGKTGVDPTMLGQLTPSTQRQVWRELVGSNDEELQIKFKEDRILGVVDIKQALPDYRLWVDRTLNDLKEEPTGISNFTSEKGSVGYGIVTAINTEPQRRVGDVLHSGIYVHLNGKVVGRPYSLRYICTNGAVAPRYDREYTFTDDNYPILLSKLLVLAEEFNKSFAALDDKPLGNVGGQLGHLSQSHVLNTQQSNRILQQIAVLEDDATAYDFVNLITQQQHENPNSIKWLEVGGRTVNHFSSNFCSHCGNSLRN